MDSVPLARYDAERENVEQRLAAIEQALSERPDDDWPSLRDRLARLEEEWTQHAMNPPVTLPVAPSPASSNPSPPPRIAEPSFRLIGIERRAGVEMTLLSLFSRLEDPRRGPAKR